MANWTKFTFLTVEGSIGEIKRDTDQSPYSAYLCVSLFIFMPVSIICFQVSIILMQWFYSIIPVITIVTEHSFQVTRLGFGLLG